MKSINISFTGISKILLYSIGIFVIMLPNMGKAVTLTGSQNGGSSFNPQYITKELNLGSLNGFAWTNVNLGDSWAIDDKRSIIWQWTMPGSPYDSEGNYVPLNEDDAKRQDLVSSNTSVVQCSGTSSCSAVGYGTATVTVPFRKGYAGVTKDTPRPGSFSFNMQSAEFYINVVRPNLSPTATYINTTDIGYTGFKSNWSYSDPEGDIQTAWNLQIATDAGFSNLVRNVSAADSGTSRNINGLEANTTYYPRIRVYNNINGWSGWSNGAPFSTKPYPQANITFNVTDVNGSPTIAKNGEKLRFDWSLTNSIGVASCIASATGGTIDANNIWTGVKSVSNGTQNKILPVRFTQLDRDHNYTLSCTPKPGGPTITSVTKTINVKGSPATVSLTRIGSGDVNSGDTVQLKRTITNREVLTSCTNKVLGGIVESGGSFTSNSTKDNIPSASEKISSALSADTTYVFKTECTAVDGSPVSSEFSVDVKPIPKVSCSLRSSVVARNKISVELDLTGTSTAAAPYDWTINRRLGDSIIDTNNTLNWTKTLDYTDLVNSGLGKYQVTATLSVGGRTSALATCGTVTNLGNKNIREISP